MNRDFYDGYAQSFSSTRFDIQPGIRSLLPLLLTKKSILDLGSGNGNLARALFEEGFEGNYFGIDNSLGLLVEAKANLPKASTAQYSFEQIDLSNPNLFFPQDAVFDAIVCFAVIHHFPEAPYLNHFFQLAHKNLPEGGYFILSTWQVKNNPRLQSRIQDWALAGLQASQLSNDDLLIDWRGDPNQPPRYRYVRHYDSGQLKATAENCSFILRDEFYSDGKEGDLALYQVWQKPA